MKQTNRCVEVPWLVQSFMFSDCANNIVFPDLNIDVKSVENRQAILKLIGNEIWQAGKPICMNDYAVDKIEVRQSGIKAFVEPEYQNTLPEHLVEDLSIPITISEQTWQEIVKLSEKEE